MKQLFSDIVQKAVQDYSVWEKEIKLDKPYNCPVFWLDSLPRQWCIEVEPRQNMAALLNWRGKYQS